LRDKLEANRILSAIVPLRLGVKHVSPQAEAGGIYGTAPIDAEAPIRLANSPSPLFPTCANPKGD
jgi:hypothetical protein